MLLVRSGIPRLPGPSENRTGAVNERSPNEQRHEAEEINQRRNDRREQERAEWFALPEIVRAIEPGPRCGVIHLLKMPRRKNFGSSRKFKVAILRPRTANHGNIDILAIAQPVQIVECLKVF